jgi:hypothetical protein
MAPKPEEGAGRCADNDPNLNPSADINVQQIIKKPGGRMEQPAPAENNNEANC